jgi:Tfp pilus assembly PilM family ATPase
VKRNGVHVGFDLRPDMIAAVRHDADGLRGDQRPLDPQRAAAEARQEQLAALRDLAEALQVGRHEVDVTVPRSQAIEKRLLLPAVEAHELEPLVRFQLAKDLPFDLEAVTVAWQVVPQASESGTVVACVAVRRERVDALRALLREAGLTPGRILVATDAAARGLALAGASKGRALLLDVHPGATDIVILNQGQLAFSRTSSAGPGAEGWQERLASELSRTLTAAEPDCGGRPDALYLAGASDEALAAALTKRLELPVTSLGPAGDAARLVAARGLADPSPAPGPAPLDLAHAARFRHARTQKRQLAAAALVVALLAVVSLLVARSQVSAREGAVAELRDERTRLAPRARAAASIQRELAAAEAWTDRKGRELEVLLAVTRALPEDEAYLTQLRWSENGELQLGGRAKEWETVGRFFAALDRDPLIESADFADVRRPREKGALGYVFTGSARLVEGGAP